MHDEGHEWTNGQIEELTQRIHEVYREAGQEAERRLREFIRKFEAKDAILRKKLEDGKITEADYRDWMRGQVFQGERWKAQVRDLAETLSRANELAMSMVNESAPEVFAYNANWAAFEIERAGNADMGFGLYDADTVRWLLRDEPQLLPPSKVDVPKDVRWNSKKITNQIMQGIILGEKLDNVAKRLRRVAGMNENSSLTHARTAMTGAQNAGRIETYHRTEDMGIRMRKEWLAALDSHTRETHGKLDGQKAEVDEPFRVDGFEIMYPGDPAAAPEMVYNCRCTLIADLIDYPAQDAKRRVGSIGSPTIRDMTFAQWAGWKRQEIALSGYKPLTTKDLDANMDVKISGRVRRIVDGAGKKVTRDFPILDEYLHQVAFGAQEEGNPASAELSITPDGYVGQVISLNHKMWSDLQELQRFIKREAETGGHIRAKSVEAIITHEYGHIAYNSAFLRILGYTGQGRMTIEQRRRIPQVRDWLDEQLKSIQKEYGGEQLSDRAADGYDEMTAEAFSDFYSGTKSNLSCAVVNMFKELLK